MTRGFYDQIGVPFDADLDQVRAAYGRSVAQILRRREATVTQGGDTAALDLARAQLDEAWEVLSDPPRRRRYDAMLAAAADGSPVTDPAALWVRVAGAMIHPSVAAGARFVDATTRLRIGPLPEEPRAAGARPPAPGWEEEATLTSRVQAVMRDGFGARRTPARGDGQGPATSPGLRDVPPVTPQAPSQAFVREPASVFHQPTLPPVPASQAPADPRPPDASGVHRVPVAEPPATPRLQVNAPMASVPATPAPAPARVVIPAPEPARVQVGPSGALLRSAREAKGLSLQQVSEATRISVRYLDALEAEDFAALPSAAAFVKGYVKAVAKLLDLDTDRVADGYMRRFSGDV